ncbi:MAG: hypothetical protein KAY46_03790 [Burkholderiaceae bacterium]|nr:hypothetical protein [Burkholderiaceae bacterium]
MTERFGLSSLSLSLILLALLAVAGVLVYNAWVSRRRGGLRRDATLSPPAGRGTPERAASSGGATIRSEPSLGARAPGSAQGGKGHGQVPAAAGKPGAAPAPVSAQAASAATEPRLGDLSLSDDGTVPTADVGASGAHSGGHEAEQGAGESAAPGAPAASGDAAGSGARLHPLTDCIIEFQLAEPVAADRLLASVHAFRRVGSKPVVIEASGAAADEPGQSSWAPMAARQRLARVRVGVLLANRHGPLNAMEYSEFVTGVQALAEQLAVLGDTPDMNTVLQRARSLDEACAALDAQIGLNVEAPDALGLVDLARLAQETRCTERGNNRHARLSEHGEVVFSLSLSDSPTRLSLLLDVPRAPLAAQPWQEMVACARHCAQRLGGRLVDDQGRALTDASLQRIEQQLTERQQALSAAGLVPGSALALRVFN